MALLVQYLLVYEVVLVLVAIGGCFSEHGGIINLGLEGIMVIGAMAGILSMEFFADSQPFVIVFMAMLMSVISGMLYSLLLGVAAIRFKADQVLVGTALNLLGTAATVVIKAYNMSIDPINISSEIRYIEQKKAFVVNVFGMELSWLFFVAAAVLIISLIVLYRTKFGLRLMACGENPAAADNVGINVSRMRYYGVLISGALAGLGGLAYATAGVSSMTFEKGVAGFGFLALTVMIFGQWRPDYIALAGLIFGFFRALSNVYGGFDFLSALNIPGPFYNIQPYLISLIVLIFVSKRSKAPKAEGIPYDKEKR